MTFKRFYIIVIALFFTITNNLTALPVGKQHAIHIATNYYLSAHPESDKIKDISVSFVYSDVHLQSNAITFYAVNFSDTGFVLISGDNSLSPVLGYSYTSFFTGDDIPVQLSGLLEEYRNLYDHIITHEPLLYIETQTEWDALETINTVKTNRAVVNPLIPCFWDQGAFYNMLCPEDDQGPGERVYAGCVATAMSMVMYHFRYPQQGQGQHGYYSDYGYLSVDFSQSEYIWNNMPVRLTGKNYPVAKLMYDAGVAVDMMYSANGSGAYMDDAADAMSSYFKYSPSLSLEYRDNYTFTDWVNLLKGQLNQGYPLIYAGYGSNGPGHAFVCDGYDNGNLFHFNWGWSGAYNGFYVMDYLTPGSYSFSNWQQAVINCFPADNSFPYSCQGHTVVNGSAGTITDGSGPENYSNNSNCSWLIQPEILTESISLTFHRLNTESNSDVLCVYAGPDASFPLIGCYSGNSLPNDITHQGNSLFLTFQTNQNVNDLGFFIEYSSVPMKFCENMIVLSSSSGTIEDGSGSYPYQPGSLCRWMIAPDNAGAIVFDFQELDTEPDNDIIVLLDNSTFPSTEIIRFSGNQIPETYVYEGSQVILMFKTDDYQQHSGWKVNYSTWAVSVDENIAQNITVFPNPFNDYLSLTGISANTQILLTDLSGRVIYETLVSQEVPVYRIPLFYIADGLYLLQMRNGEDTKIHKVLKHQE